MSFVQRALSVPGVSLAAEELPSSLGIFRTGVPAFLGFPPALPRTSGDPYRPCLLTMWSQFGTFFGGYASHSLLAYAVRGFFENGGERCFVVPLRADGAQLEQSYREALRRIEEMQAIDLVCAPDLYSHRDASSNPHDIQRIIMEHCSAAGGRLAILDVDSSRSEDAEAAASFDEERIRNLKQALEDWSAIDGANGALYYPWLEVPELSGGQQLVEVPPCGHIAGVYARTDRIRGVHKAPANEEVYGASSLNRFVTAAEQGVLNPRGINCLRWFRGRGIRVWGARTLANDPSWRYVNVRRIFLTALRWIDMNMWDVVFEPNDPALWARIERELRTYFQDLFRKGALQGPHPGESFYVKCNQETNPPDAVNEGKVQAEIGLAAAAPFEFIVVRLTYGIRGVELSGPAGPGVR